MKTKQLTHSTISKIVQLSLVKEPELLCVLHSFFKYATHPLPHRARRFGDNKSGHYLDVQFKADGTIGSMDGELDEIQAKALSDQVSSTLLENQTQLVGQSLCFSQHDAVQGVYRYKDIFQVFPIPAEAPHAPMIAADHPFVLQFKYLSCSDATINGHRRTEKAVKLTRILNTLCGSAVFPSARYVQHFWGICPDKEFTCRLTQEGYGYPGFAPELKEFSASNELPAIQLFPAATYYDINFFSGDYAVTLPDSIEKYLDKVLSLKDEHAKRFEIASTWFSQVNGLWPQSSSSALIAVVSAIEALLEKSSDFCKECGQPKFEITKKFRAFLKEYVPGIEEVFPEEFKAIYGMRSDLAHGNALLAADLEYWNYFGTPLQQWQDEFQRNTFYITATALRNWVLAR
jgi:hypothetical protein